MKPHAVRTAALALRLWALAVLALLLWVWWLPAQAQTPAAAPAATTARFDHLTTGFPLSGTHANARCESCHLKGQLKGTPRDCATCHTAGTAWSRANLVKSAQHVPTTERCDSCHNTRQFDGARFNHQGVVAGSCASCHNGATASGKPAQHLSTTASCDSCHSTSGWSGARPDHGAFGAGTDCSSCHNGRNASGKSASHIPVGGATCQSCHGTAAWKPSRWNHTQVAVAGQCASCHNGSFPPADGRPANHLPYAQVTVSASAGCDACHKSGFSTWGGARFHANFSPSAQCATCHNGSFPGATGKPATAVHNGVTACENCHTAAGWAGAKVDHGGFGAGTDCGSCHNGRGATGKPGSHIPVGSTNCQACHATSGWKPSRWSHTQLAVAGQCASCHSGGFPPADGRPANHVPYTQVAAAAGANCDTCHRSGFGSWDPGRLHANVRVGSQCATCHTGSFLGATGKPATPIHNGATACESCHVTTGWGGGGKPDHAGFNQATNCASCHDGRTATGKAANHIPAGLTNCFACHATSAWRPSRWNHTQVVVTRQCSSCHTGTFPPADGKPANHVPYALVAAAANANCDTCHKSGYGHWNPGRLHANVSVSSQCSTCHTGSYLGATGKPATQIHAGQTSCESCHNTVSWTNAKVDHAAFNQATNCASCHDGRTATGKAANHIPSGSASCFACHATSGWKPSKWNHGQVVVARQCASCHTGAYPPADGKPANHVPHQLVPVAASANCDACHKAGYGSWNPGRFHGNFSVSNLCATCHTGSYLGARGKPANALHSGVTTCEGCHRSSSDWGVVQFQHGANQQVGSGTCDTCHNGNTARGKPTGHIPVQSAAVKCDGCHRSQAAWSTAVTTNHSLLAGQSCKSCHTATYASQGLQAKPANHIPEAQLLNGSSLDCSGCHTGTSTWGSVRMNHNASLGGGAGWCKACHASGTAYLGNMERKSLTHEAKGKTPIDCSESGCHRPLGSKGKTFTEWD